MKRLVLFAALAILATGCSKYPKTMSGFESDPNQLEPTLVMPARFQLIELGAFSAQAASELNHLIEQEIRLQCKYILDASPVDIRVLDTSDEALLADPELRAAIAALNDEIDRAQAAVAETKGKTIDIDFEGDMDYVAEEAEAEFLLFVDGIGQFPTGGAVAKDVIFVALLGVSTGAKSVTQMRMTLVDSRSGKLLWSHFQSANRDPRKPNDLFQHCKKMLEPLTGKLKLKAPVDRPDKLEPTSPVELEAAEAGR